MESLRWYGTGETGASGEAGGGTRPVHEPIEMMIVCICVYICIYLCNFNFLSKYEIDI